MDPHNPHYGEEGAVYGRVYYSAGASQNQQSNTPKPMAEIKLPVSHKNPTELVDEGSRLVALNAPEPPEPAPIPNMSTPIADLVAKLTPAKTANDAYEAMKKRLRSLKTERDRTAKALATQIVLTGKAAVKEAKGDPVMLQKGGFEIASSTPGPSAAMGQPQNVVLGNGRMPGTASAKCRRDPNASTYEWQVTTGDPVTGPYVTNTHTTAAKATLKGLTSGQRIWVRVRAIGSTGEGPWSDPAMMIVP